MNWRSEIVIIQIDAPDYEEGAKNARDTTLKSCDFKAATPQRKRAWRLATVEPLKPKGSNTKTRKISAAPPHPRFVDGFGQAVLQKHRIRR